MAMVKVGLDALKAHLHAGAVGNPARISAANYFVDMIKSGMEGLRTLGMDLELHADGVDPEGQPKVDPMTHPAMESIESAIKHMGGGVL